LGVSNFWGHDPSARIRGKLLKPMSLIVYYGNVVDAALLLAEGKLSDAKSATVARGLDLILAMYECENAEALPEKVLSPWAAHRSAAGAP